MRVLHIGALVACIAGCVAAVPVLASASTERTAYMLGDDVAPVSYELHIAPRLPVRAFGTSPVDGEETIQLDVRAATNAVTLNAAGIAVLEATVDGAPAAGVDVDKTAQQVAIRSREPLNPGRHTVHLRFTSSTLPDAAGLWYDGFAAENAPNLVTLFEPARARSLFPCFDEPRFRAPFHVFVTMPRAWTTISNMPVAKTRDVGAEQRETEFLPTPPMPAYLLTLDSGVFDVVRDTSGRVPISVYARPGQSDLGRNVLAKTRAAFDYFEKAFGTSYPLPKLDVVIASGVLNDSEEGWGAITIYTEYQVSGNGAAGDLTGEQMAYNIVASDVAQQWLGGLVGINSWGDSWLTSGLGQWEAEHAAAARGLGSRADIDWSWNAMSFWGSKRALVTQPRDDRDPASFDALNAGAGPASTAILDSYESAAGADAMNAAVRRYIQANSLKTPRASEFWDAFGTDDARRYGAAWLNQPGAPVVDVEPICDRGRGALELRQHQLHGPLFASRAGSLWPIPIEIQPAGLKRYFASFATAGPVREPAGACGTPVVVDSGIRPPYLVHYPEAMLRAMLTNSAIEQPDRLRILRDAVTLYETGDATLPELLTAMQMDPDDARTFTMHSLADDLSNAMVLLAQSNEVRPVTSLTVDTYRPLLETFGRSSGTGVLLDPARAMYALSYTGDRQAGQVALQWWRKPAGRPSFVLSFANDMLAGTAASNDDVTAVLRYAASPARQFDNRMILLFGLSDPAEIARALRTLALAHHPNLIPTIVAIGKRHPATVARWLQSNAQLVLKTIPPTQQGWQFSDAVANGPWAAQSPERWRAFLNRYLSPMDRTNVDRAVKKITINWQKRRALETQLANAKSRSVSSRL